MEETKLREILEELHAELLRLGPLEEDEQEKVDALTAGICEVLSEPSLENSHASLEELAEDSLTSFEAAHPQIFQLLQGILKMVSDMGI